MAPKIGNDTFTPSGPDKADDEQIGIRLLLGTIAAVSLVMAFAILVGSASINVETLFAPLWR